MIKKIGLQLYTVAAHMRDEALTEFTLNRIKALGYDQAQTAGFGGTTVERFAQLAKNAGIEIVGTHIDFDKITADPDQTMEDHKILGTTNIGIGGMPSWALADEESVYKFCNAANEFADKINKYGFKFTYHHHSFEFKKFQSGDTIMDILVRELDPVKTSFVLDTYWLQHGGADVRAWIEKLSGRVDILHLKDMERGKDGPSITSVGNGNLEWKGIVESAEKAGIKYFVVEQDNNHKNNNAFAAIKDSADYIKANLM